MREAEFLTESRPLAAYERNFRIAGTPVSIAVNHPTLAARVERYFSPFADEPADDAIRVVGLHDLEAPLDRDRLRQLQHHSGSPKEAYYDVDDLRVVLKTRTGVVHYLKDREFHAIGDLIRFPRQLLNLVSAAYAYSLRQEGYLALHAAGVSSNGTGIAFAANSGSGKSSVALRLLEAGNDFVSNDRIYLKRDGDAVVMAGVPKWPRVNPGTLLSMESLRGLMAEEKRKLYSRMPPEELWHVEDKHDVRVDSVFGTGRIALRSRLWELYVLNWRRQSGPMSVTEVSPGDLPALVMPVTKTSVYDPPWTAAPTDEELHEALGPVHVFSVRDGLDISGLVNHVASPAGAAS